MSKYEDVREDIDRMSVFRLADYADVSCPDNQGSPGAMMLKGVRDAVLDQFDREERYPSDVIHEIADGGPSVYTYQRWTEFVDLCAWNEDLDEIGQPDDLTDAAGVALYLICERLATALWTMLDEAAQADEDEEE